MATTNYYDHHSRGLSVGGCPVVVVVIVAWFTTYHDTMINGPRSWRTQQQKLIEKKDFQFTEK